MLISVTFTDIIDTQGLRLPQLALTLSNETLQMLKFDSNLSTVSMEKLMKLPSKGYHGFAYKLDTITLVPNNLNSKMIEFKMNKKYGPNHSVIPGSKIKLVDELCNDLIYNHFFEEINNINCKSYFEHGIQVGSMFWVVERRLGEGKNFKSTFLTQYEKGND